MTGGVHQRPGDGERVGLVERAQRLAEIHRHTLGDACREPQHLALARRADQASSLERLDSSVPVHDGHRRADHVVDELGEPTDKVTSQQPAAVLDQQLGGCFSAQPSFCVRSQGPREVLEAGSK